MEEGEASDSVRTGSGIVVEPVYSSLADGTAESLGKPGAFPFTRGVRPDGYRSGLWVMGQYSGYASPKKTNERIRGLLDRGQRGFSVALDLPTQNGLDADHPLARGEVGKVGVPLSSLADMEELLEGIPLDKVAQVRTTANSIGPVALAFFVAAARSHGHSPEDFRVMFQNDALKEYVARGTQIFPPDKGLEFSVDVIEYCAKHLPHWEPIEFCGYHIRDSGTDAVREAAVAASNGIEYLRAAQRRGLDIDSYAKNLYMFLSADVEIFEEVAKFRAIRRVWARLMRERFHAQRPESTALNLFVYTLGGSLTAQEPLNNVTRVAYQALAAVLGGAQTLATSSYDEAMSIPTAEAAHTSLRIQQILAHEAGVAKTADPLGGSYYVEALTDEMDRQISSYIERIDVEGGALAALRSGWLAAEIEEASYDQQLALESGEKVRVGLNAFADTGPSTHEFAVFETDTSTEAEQIERLRRLRETRDADAVAAGLEQVRRTARLGQNTVPAILEAVEAYATIGEIIEALKGEWGSYR